jgi:hypothetical protein
MEIWRRGFADHRIRDAEDYDKHVHYIHLNPVKKNLCANPAECRYSSAYPGWKSDPVPQGLKPEVILDAACGTTEVVPFQKMESIVIPVATIIPVMGDSTGEYLKGRDFSRAIEGSQRPRALATEGVKP